MQSFCKETAKEKWCPMTHTRIMVMFDPACVQAAQQMKHAESETRKSNCIAGACAAWIWDDPAEVFGHCGMVGQ